MRKGSIVVLCCAAALLVFLFWRPSSAPKSHYQVLGVRSDSTAEDILHAYKELSSIKILKNGESGSRLDDIQIQHAYEILSDPLRRRDYDLYNQDELKGELKKLQRRVGASSEPQQLPLWEPFVYEPAKLETQSILTQNFELLFEGNAAWLIQVYSIASRNCWKHETEWISIYNRVEGVAKVARVELGETKLATFFADTNGATKGHFFRHGLPAYVGVSPDCRSQGCIARYTGDLSVDGVVNWMATQVLRLPRIMYYSPQTLVSDLIQKSGPHKVKVVYFSITGERATPFIRKAAKDYWDFAAFGLVLWREESATLWESMLGVNSAPALLILRDPGVKPILFKGTLNSSMLENLLQGNKNHVLPQLRSITARELGCSESGFSLAGQGEHTWYCVIVAGRPSLELNQARAVLRDVKDRLTKDAFLPENANSFVHLSAAALAFKTKRMVLAWLDGLAQKQVCLFYLNSETVHETCGAKSFPEQGDVPRVFLVRYRRHPKDREKKLAKIRQVNSFWQKLLEEDEDIASQIVAKYNGSLEAEEIISWMSRMVEEGDTQDLLYYVKKAPPLVPEESKPAWVSNAQTQISLNSRKLFSRCKSILFGLLDYVEDSRFIPTVVFLLLLYLGSLFYIRT